MSANFRFANVGAGPLAGLGVDWDGRGEPGTSLAAVYQPGAQMELSYPIRAEEELRETIVRVAYRAAVEGTQFEQEFRIVPRSRGGWALEARGDRRVARQEPPTR
jgi:hypothetical protein